MECKKCGTETAQMGRGVCFDCRSPTTRGVNKTPQRPTSEPPAATHAEANPIDELGQMSLDDQIKQLQVQIAELQASKPKPRFTITL